MRLSSHIFCRLSVFLLGLSAFLAIAALDPAVLQQQLVARYGQERVPLLKNWLGAIQAVKTKSDEVRLRQINDFINQHIHFEDDISVWQQSDYWATPLETIGQGRGDCEDFAIIKYVALREAGIAVETRAEWDQPEVGRFARLHDPEGNAIELWQPPA